MVVLEALTAWLRHSAARLGELFPQLHDLRVESYWEGYCALTPSYLPAVHILGENIYGVVGFSTRGVSLAQNLGREMARYLCEEIAQDDLPVNVSAPRPIPFQRTKTFLGGFAFPVYQARDRLGLT